MKSIAKIVSWLSLVVLMVPVILLMMGRTDLDTVKIVMNICTVVWFATASIWMWNSDTKQA
jgi:hypothetical protein